MRFYDGLTKEKQQLRKKEEQLRTEKQFVLLRQQKKVTLSSSKLGAAAGKCPHNRRRGPRTAIRRAQRGPLAQQMPALWSPPVLSEKTGRMATSSPSRERSVDAYDAELDTANIEELRTPARKGFVAVEWGGMNLNGVSHD